MVDDLVITGVSGADDGIRGFIAAYKATTGELAWRTWTVPKPGEPLSETWKGSALAEGGGGTWLSGSYDTASDVLYWSVGNPHPDTDGDERLGSNLYTNSDLAIEAKTGRFSGTTSSRHMICMTGTQMSPSYWWIRSGKDRSESCCCTQIATAFCVCSRPHNWSTPAGDEDGGSAHLGERHRPQDLDAATSPANETTAAGTVTCPAVRGATNWYSTAFNPMTRLYYVMTVEDCGMYRKAENGGFGRYNDPAHPAQKILRAFDIETGKATWAGHAPRQRTS